MGTVYDQTAAELERQCHRGGTFMMSPTGMATLAVKISYLVEELEYCSSLEERVDLLIREFELDSMPYPEEENNE